MWLIIVKLTRLRGFFAMKNTEQKWRAWSTKEIETMQDGKARKNKPTGERQFGKINIKKWLNKRLIGRTKV